MNRVLIAGMGNIFFGDDAFGCEVIREIAARGLPPIVDVVDFGIRSYDLAYALTSNYQLVILVDALARDQAPGTVYLIEPERTELPSGAGSPNPHSLDAVAVLGLAQALGGITARLYLVGCEPAVVEAETDTFSLSEPVRQAVPRAMALIDSLVQTAINSRTPTDAGAVPA